MYDVDVSLPEGVAPARCHCTHVRNVHLLGADGFLYDCLSCTCGEYHELLRSYDRIDDRG